MRSSLPPALGLGWLAILSSACFHVHESVRPAAELDAVDPTLNPRYFSPPITLAVAEDAIVRIVGPATTCSGTLIDEDLVLTAHHCVVELKDGAFTSNAVAPADMHIELGGDYLPWGTVDVKAIVAPPCGERGGRGDVAVIVLSHKIIGITPYSARLDSPPRVGETLDPAGFGRCALSPDGIHRSVRAGGDVDTLRNGTIQMTASICPGDSGGPVFARGSHEVVGVVSLSAMDGDERTRSASVMARVDSFRSLFGRARQIADGAEATELPPLSSCGE